MVGIEEVAQRNNLTLFKTSRSGQYKAHCPVCGDKGHNFHLYVSEIKQTFYCHKCGSRGGVVAFHAWLSGIDFETAKAQLYPQVEGRPKRRLNPAETLTKAQLQEMGFTMRTPRRKAPAGIDPMQWRRHRKAELDWIWQEWREHEETEKLIRERLTRLVEESDKQQVAQRPSGAVQELQRIDLRLQHNPKQSQTLDVCSHTTVLCCVCNNSYSRPALG